MASDQYSVGGSNAGARPKSSLPTPKTIEYKDISFDIFTDLLSFYVRTINLLVSQDLDIQTADLGLSGGTGKIATLLLVGANPGIRPSVLAHLIRKDRSAMGKLIEHMEQKGLVEQRVSPAERRARELYLTARGRALAQRTRDVARRQDDDFFSPLGADERRTLLALLRKLYVNYLDLAPHSEA